MEDVHALVRAVSKTQTEFAIKHISCATISRKPDLVNCIQTTPLAVTQLQPIKDCGGIKSLPERRDSGIDEHHPSKRMRRAG